MFVSIVLGMLLAFVLALAGVVTYSCFIYRHIGLAGGLLVLDYTIFSLLPLGWKRGYIIRMKSYLKSVNKSFMYLDEYFIDNAVATANELKMYLFCDVSRNKYDELLGSLPGIADGREKEGI